MLSPRFKDQIEARGLAVADAEQQLQQFRAGFQFVELDRPATVGDGIIRFDEIALQRFTEAYDEQSAQHRIVKFVPASGAATRMFRDLLALRETGQATEQTDFFFEHLSEFPFYASIEALTGANPSKEAVLDVLFGNDGLHYDKTPKALLPFHGANQPRMAIEEHCEELVQYAIGANSSGHLHLTVSPQHEKAIRAACKTWMQQTGHSIEVETSFQQSSTDTVAVDLANNPVTDSADALVFRPAGHGALLENLNQLQADVVFIKNIDNVVPPAKIADTVTYKKALAGKLLQLQRIAFDLLRVLDDVELSQDQLHAIATEVEANFGLRATAHTVEELRNLINRPIRVCGMVENTGEPGGGPFWVRTADGQVSLQIVEKAQIDVANDAQLELLNSATHFNPVDLVCGLRDYHGNAFNLLEFRDSNQFFISEKSFEGNPIKALELPGLWNGAMAGWITVFVEVPISTFNPVKTVNDLLKPGHRA